MHGNKCDVRERKKDKRETEKEWSTYLGKTNLHEVNR